MSPITSQLKKYGYKEKVKHAKLYEDIMKIFLLKIQDWKLGLLTKIGNMFADNMLLKYFTINLKENHF